MLHAFHMNLWIGSNLPVRFAAATACHNEKTISMAGTWDLSQPCATSNVRPTYLILFERPQYLKRSGHSNRNDDFNILKCHEGYEAQPEDRAPWPIGAPTSTSIQMSHTQITDQWGERRGKTSCVDDWPSEISEICFPVFHSCSRFSSRRTPWHYGFRRLISGQNFSWKTFSSNRELFWVHISFTGFETGPLLCLPVTQSSLGRLLASFPLVENLFQASNFHFSLRFGHVELCSWRDFGSFHGKWHCCSANCRRWTKRKQQDVEILDFLKLWTCWELFGCCLRLKTCAPKPPLLHSKEIVVPVTEWRQYEMLLFGYCLIPRGRFPIHVGWFPNHPFWDSETSLVSRWHAEVVLHWSLQSVFMFCFCIFWGNGIMPATQELGVLDLWRRTCWHSWTYRILKLYGWQEHTQSNDNDPEVGRLRKLDVNEDEGWYFLRSPVAALAFWLQSS